MPVLPYVLQHENAKAPERGSTEAAGFDLYAAAVRKADNGDYIEYDTGVALAIPSGHAGFVFPRSSISNTDMQMRNCVGVIDADYRGTIKVRMTISPKTNGLRAYRVGDKVAQLVILPLPEMALTRADTLSETTRGQGGFGSTGV